MVKNTGSRVFHVFMVVACAIVCLLAIISFGSFANEHQKIRRTYHGHDNHCILFSDSAGKNTSTILLSNSRPCMFAIWGEVSVFFLALILGVMFTVKALMAANALSIFSVVELIIIIITAILDFAVAVVISTGLHHTCVAMKKSSEESSDLPCSHYDHSDNSTISFHRNMNTSKGTAWTGTVMLAVLTVIHFILLCAYCCHHRRPESTDSEPYSYLIMTTVGDSRRDETV